MHRYLVDIETYSNYFFVGIKRIGEEARRGFELSDRSDFDRAWMRRFIINRATATFNGMSYDLPVLLYACTPLDNGEYPTNAQIKEVSDRIILGMVKYWEVENVIGFRIPWGINHIDLIEPQPNPFASLKILNGRLHGKQMQDLPFAPDRILTHEEMDLVSHYCLQNDLDASENLWNAMREPMELREVLSEEILVDLRSKSDTQMGLAIIKHRAEELLGRKIEKASVKPGHSFKYKAPAFIKFQTPQLQAILERIQEHRFVVRDDGKVDLPPWLADTPLTIGDTTYAMGIGGLHSTEANRAVVSDEDFVLVDADVASYYPAIILSLGLYPEAIGPRFLEIYRGIRDDRVKAKKAGNKTKDKGLKIALNGTFGSLGSRFSFVYAPHLMISVTLTGQLALLMLIEAAELQGIPVVSGNTDGMVFKLLREHFEGITKDRLNGGLLADITGRWEKATGFDLEFVEYRAIYNASVNSYFAIKANGGHKRKGPFANPWSEDKNDYDLRGQMMKNPQATICSDAALARIKHGTPLRDTIIGCQDIRQFVTVIKVSKGATWRDNYLGKTIRYYWSTDGDEVIEAEPNSLGNFKKVPKTDGAKPAMRLPDDFPDDVDYERYISEAEQILKDIGFYGAPEPKEKRIRLTKVNKQRVLSLWLLSA
ncbi:hypothetical protein IQ03_04815 [Gemmobacter caeni]|uniref:Uncharacterized protein n=1 Tax=Gemmobacter caeni TaxID=589035 RepID=A0A2T6AZ84_9RHOB|nr:hypothetical protein [Gemmobacter caeni]PTX49119.1 hypothetical protein C8N34_108229 [Gemmobacter caeni]TWI93456.1 hypothetical protein IQ03_04815 [Gemmobacter caeni]